MYLHARGDFNNDMSNNGDALIHNDALAWFPIMTVGFDKNDVLSVK